MNATAVAAAMVQDAEPWLMMAMIVAVTAIMVGVELIATLRFFGRMTAVAMALPMVH